MSLGLRLSLLLVPEPGRWALVRVSLRALRSRQCSWGLVGPTCQGPT